jgi:DNA-directed RNA polymerase specialized sigma24 family protein
MKTNFFTLLNQIKTQPEKQDQILNQIRLELFLLLYNYRQSFDYDAEEGNSTALANLSMTDINNFIARLEKEEIAFTPNNEKKISNFFVNYFKRCCYNKAQDVKRSKARLVSYDVTIYNTDNISYLDLIPSPSPTPEEALILEEKQDLINSLFLDPELQSIHLKGLPSCNLSAIMVRRLRNQSFQSIATEFNVKLGSLTSFWHRAKPLLREKLQVLT